MTDRWARVAKWGGGGHNLTFIFFTLERGCKRILFCSYFKGLLVRKVQKYFIKQTFKLQYCCSFSPEVFTVVL